MADRERPSDEKRIEGQFSDTREDSIRKSLGNSEQANTGRPSRDYYTPEKAERPADPRKDK